MTLPVISIQSLSKKYTLGQVDAGTFKTSIGRWGRYFRGGSSASCGSTSRDRELWALRDVSFEVQAGEVLGVIGRNGAGKSTLLKILSRITEPTSGRAVLRGRIASLLEIGTGFHPELTGRENIYLNGAILGMKKTEITAKFDEILAFAEVEKFIDTPVKRYSSGMYVRLAFAVAAHLEPEVLIVDEVLAVGDAAFQKKCLGRMENVAAEGRTVLFVTHNMASIVRLCPKAVLLSRGCLAGMGPSDEIVRQYLSETGRISTQLINDLRGAVRWEGAQQQIFTLISLHREDGVPSLEYFTGDTIRFRVGYHWEGRLPAYCRINILNSIGERVLSMTSQHCGQPLEISGDGAIECVIRDNRLVTGEYVVMIEAGRQFPSVEWLDCIPEAMRFRVSVGSYLGGLEAASGQGMVAQKSEWSVATE